MSEHKASMPHHEIYNIKLSSDVALGVSQGFFQVIAKGK